MKIQLRRFQKSRTASLALRLLASACGLALATIPALSAPPAQTPNEQAQARMAKIKKFQQDSLEQLKRGVVKVTAQSAASPDSENANVSHEAGTGIVLSSTPQSALILTALHVVEGASSIAVTFSDGQMKPYPAHKLPKHSKALDLAVIQVNFSAANPSPGNFPTYNFAANNTLQSTQHLFTVNGDGIIVANNITRLNHDDDPQKFEYSNVSVGKGFSGGPIFDDYEDIIGIHLARTQDESYAIGDKIESALQVLEALGYTVPKAGPVVMPDYSSVIGTPRGASSASNPESNVPVPSRRLRPSAAGPCVNGCESTLAKLRHVQQYQNQTRAGNCVEAVYAFPKGWPEDDQFLHASYCPGAKGSLAQMVSIRMAGTDRAGDGDVQLGMATLSGSTGQGFLKTPDGGHWKMLLKNPAFGQTIDLNAISITVQPY